MTTYNGWTNYETWRVNLEMFDGMSPEDVLGTADRPEVKELADAMEDWAKDHVTQQASGLALDYALTFLEPVNWQEIAQDMIDAHAPYETEGEDA